MTYLVVVGRRNLLVDRLVGQIRRHRLMVARIAKMVAVVDLQNLSIALGPVL